MSPLLNPDDPLAFLWLGEPQRALPTEVLVLLPGMPDAVPEGTAALPPALLPAGDTVLPAAAPFVAVELLPVAGLAAGPVVGALAPPAVTPVEAMAVLAASDLAPRADTTADPLAASALVPEEAFPTPAELDAILAAHAGPAAGPDAAERAEAVALLGLDPAIAADPVLYAETLARLPEPDADQVLEQWLRDHDVEVAAEDLQDHIPDWQIG